MSAVTGPRKSRAFVASRLLSLVTGVLLLPSMAHGDQILETNNASLTTYVPSAKSNIQDVRPLVDQRGVLLAGGSEDCQGGCIGDPDDTFLPEDFCDDVIGGPGDDVAAATYLPGRRVTRYLNSIDLFTGTYRFVDVDLSFPADVPWVISRSYNTRQKDSGGSYYASSGHQGKNWFSNIPEMVFHEGATDPDDMVCVLYGADRYIEFRRGDDTGTGDSTDTFQAVNGAAGAIVITTDAEGPDLATYYSQNGNRMVFFWADDVAHTPAAKQFALWKKIDPAGSVAYIGHATDASTALSGYTAGGAPKTLIDSTGRKFTCTYTSGMLTQVKAEVNSGGWTEVGKVDYSYYVNADAHGEDDDLKLVTVTLPLSSSGDEQVQNTCYWYYDGSYDATNNPGYHHQIQYIVSDEGYRKSDWLDSTWDNDPLTASEGDLKPYASAYFEYDTERRIVSSYSGGACGCSGAADGTHTFEYEDNTEYSNGTGYDSAEAEWKMRTVVQKPDVTYKTASGAIESWVTQYFDEVGQPLHRVLTDGDPDGSPSLWATKVIRNSDGQITDIHSPANVTAYTHTIGGSWGFTTSTTAGLVRTFTRVTTGDMTGFVEDSKHKEGTSGSAYLDSTVEYDSATKTVGDFVITRPFIDASWVYSEETTTEAGGGSGPSGAYETTASYTFYTGDAVLMPKIITRTNPTVSTANNGSGSATTSKRYMRKDGSTAFVESESSSFTYIQYTDGQLTKQIQDAQTNHATDFATGDDPNTAFAITENGDGVRRVTTFTYDDQGRRDLATQPNGRVFKAYYSKLADGRFVTLLYNDYEDLATDKYYGPVSYIVNNQAGKTEVQAIIGLTSDESTESLTNHIDETASDPILAVETTTNKLGDIDRLVVNVYDEPGGTLEETRPYFSIPASGSGSDGTNYDATFFGYDARGGRARVKAPHGTITLTDYDTRGLTVGSWIGTNDNGFNGGEPSGTDNMVKTMTLEYDSGNDKGNRYLTKRTLYVEDSDTDKRETTFSRDVLGRTLLVTNPTAPHTFSKYDNMGRLIASGRFSSTSSIIVGTDDPTTETANRLYLSQAFYDQKGQVWKAQRHKIDAADGSDDDKLQTLTWYNAVGQVVKFDGEQLTKSKYDSLGRQTHQFTLASDNDTTYAHADDVTGDIVLEETQTVFESTDSNAVLMTMTIARHPDDKGPGETTGALDSEADGDRLLVTASNLEGRHTIEADWYDRFGRLTAAVIYGTNGGSNFDRDGLTVPTRSDTLQVTEVDYHTSGAMKSQTDASGREDRYEYDDGGRGVLLINNYVNGTPSGATGDDDVHTRTVYTDGLPAKEWVDVDGDGVEDSEDQVTISTYGTTKGVSAGDSNIATGHLRQEVQHADSSGGTDVVTLAYDAQSQEIWTKDQAGNVVETDYDDSGRTEHKRITTLDADFDGAVRRISKTYDSLGRTQLVTQYDNATVGSGAVVNEVKYTYEDWGNVSKFEQDHNSTVATGGSLLYDVDYTYEKATSGRNTIRRTGMTLPDGNVITYTYHSAGNLHDDEASRVTGVKDGAVKLAVYEYTGLSRLVGTDHPEPDIMWNLYDSTSGTYPDLDGLGRITSSRWTMDLTTDIDFYDVDITYDRNSYPTLVEDNIHGGFDVEYTMDNLGRLRKAEEGTWNGSSITSRTRQQIWENPAGSLSLTQSDGWDHVRLDLNGDNDFTDAEEHDDARTYSNANELTGRDTDDNGTDNYTLTYDEVGNLTDDGEHYEYVFDVFGRLRKVNDTSDQSLVVEYKYDGLGHLIARHDDSDADGTVEDTSDDPWYYSAFDEYWREVATFRDTDSDPKEQFVYHNWGAGGDGLIDALILRDKDANTAWTSAADGTLEERIYYCQNWRGDVVLTVDSGGDIVEHVRYSSYGVAFGMPAGDTNSDGDCDKGDSADTDQIQTWIDTSTYAVLGDLDASGVVDATDKTKALNNAGKSLGRRVLSDSAVGNRRGYATYSHDAALAGAAAVSHVRHRVLLESGHWLTRDPLEFIDGANFYAYVASRPIRATDPSGTSLTFVPAGNAVNSYGECADLRCYAAFKFDESGIMGPFQTPTHQVGLVQKVTTVFGCFDCDGGFTANSGTFYEYFGLYTIARGGVTVLAGSDEFASPQFCDCAGVFFIFGETRAFTPQTLAASHDNPAGWRNEVLIEDVLCCGVPIIANPNGEHPVHYTGTPRFWSQFLCKASHSAGVTWNCCCGASGCASTISAACDPGPEPSCYKGAAAKCGGG